MATMRRWRAEIGATLLLLASAAFAQEPREPLVSAQLLAPLPAPLALAVEPRDDSDENLALRDLVIARLAERRTRVADDAPLRLRFSSTVLTDRDGQPGGSGAGRGGARGGGGRGGGRMGIPLNGGNANAGTPEARNRPAGGVRHRVTAALERRDGQVLWKGEITTAPGEHDERSLPGRLATALVDALGRTVDTRRVAGDGTPPANPR